MPVYNRPEGLRRSLSCLTNQSYSNIEIIISDNCSPDDRVRRVAESFIVQDARIRYIRQQEPLPVGDNFRYVLQQAHGDYFMWASDDDEWAENFIEQCMAILQKDGVVSVMSRFDILNRYDGSRERGKMPKLSVENRASKNALAFLSCVTPSLFYGIHRRDAIRFVLDDHFFDFYDCYFILSLILSGRVAIVDSVLYTAGIDAPSYQVKPMKEGRFLHLQYLPLLLKGGRRILQSNMRVDEKLVVMMKLAYVVVSAFLFHEVRRLFR